MSIKKCIYNNNATKAIFFLLFFPYTIKAQKADTIHSQAIQYFYIGTNLSFVSANTNNLPKQEGAYWTDIIHNKLSSPGIEIAYKALWKISHSSVSFYMGGDILYYNTCFDFNQTVKSYGGGPLFETDQLITAFNSKTINSSLLLGFRFNLDNEEKLYFHVGVEPQLRFLTLSYNKYTDTQTSYDNNGNVTGISYSSGPDSTQLSQGNINAMVGFGYTFMPTRQHSLAVELNVMRDFFTTYFKFAFLRRFAFGLDIGYKL